MHNACESSLLLIISNQARVCGTLMNSSRHIEFPAAANSHERCVSLTVRAIKYLLAYVWTNPSSEMSLTC